MRGWRPTAKRQTMTRQDLAEFDLTVEQIAVRDRQTDEEGVAWNVENKQMDRPCRGDTAPEALRVLADALEADEDERHALSVEELESKEDEDPLAP